MENLEHVPPKELTENNDTQGLWLTDQLLAQLRKSSKIGWLLLALSILLGISACLLSYYPIYLIWTKYPLKEFYLLEEGTLFRILVPVLMAAMYYFFFRGMIEGYQAWRLLRFSETDDDALLEGSERLGKMFRWLVIWAGVFVARILFGLLPQEWILEYL